MPPTWHWGSYHGRTGGGGFKWGPGAPQPPRFSSPNSGSDNRITARWVLRARPPEGPVCLCFCSVCLCVKMPRVPLEKIEYAKQTTENICEPHPAINKGRSHKRPWHWTRFPTSSHWSPLHQVFSTVAQLHLCSENPLAQHLAVVFGSTFGSCEPQKQLPIRTVTASSFRTLTSTSRSGKRHESRRRSRYTVPNNPV